MASVSSVRIIMFDIFFVAPVTRTVSVMVLVVRVFGACSKYAAREPEGSLAANSVLIETFLKLFPAGVDEPVVED